jgi:hypothetical protein
MSERARQTIPAAPQRGAADDEAARAARVRRSAWRWTLVAVAFYVGFILWNVLRASLGF